MIFFVSAWYDGNKNNYSSRHSDSLIIRAPKTVFAEDEKSDDHDDKNKHQDDKKLYCHLVDHDDGDYDNEKHDDDDEKHST